MRPLHVVGSVTQDAIGLRRRGISCRRDLGGGGRSERGCLGPCLLELLCRRGTRRVGIGGGLPSRGVRELFGGSPDRGGLAGSIFGQLLQLGINLQSLGLDVRRGLGLQRSVALVDLLELGGRQALQP